VINSISDAFFCFLFVIFLASLGADLELKNGKTDESFTITNILAIIGIDKRRSFVLVELALVLAGDLP